MKVNKMKKLSLLVTLVLMLVISLGSFSVFAEGESCTIKLAAESTSVKKGETITVTIKATNINAGTGIMGFAGELVYDANDFDVEVTKANQWSTPTCVAKDGSITIQTERSDLTPTTSDQEMVKISLTAKSDTTEGTKKIKLSNIEMSMEAEPKTFTVSEVSASIKIEGTSTENIIINNTNVNTNVNNNTNKNTNAVVNTNTNTNTNTLPKSGIDGAQSFIIVPIVICLFASIVFFIKYKKIYE